MEVDIRVPRAVSGIACDAWRPVVGYVVVIVIRAGRDVVRYAGVQLEDGSAPETERQVVHRHQVEPMAPVESRSPPFAAQIVAVGRKQGILALRQVERAGYRMEDPVRIVHGF